MQCFRLFSCSVAGRLLSVVLLYVLVAQAVLGPLLSTAAAQTLNNELAINCLSEPASFADDEPQAHARSPLRGQEHKDCMKDCLAFADKNAVLDENLFFKNEQHNDQSQVRIRYKTYRQRLAAISILATGKAPGAPPAA